MIYDVIPDSNGDKDAENNASKNVTKVKVRHGVAMSTMRQRVTVAIEHVVRHYDVITCCSLIG